MEGDWQPGAPGAGDPLVLFGLPDQDQQRNKFEIAVRHIGSIYLTHSWSGTIKSLSEFPPEDLPYVPIVFFAFRIMVGLGFLIFGIGAIGLLLRRSGHIYTAGWFQWLAVVMGPAG